MTNLNKKITGIFKMKNLFTKNYWAMKGLAMLVLVVMGGSVRGQQQINDDFSSYSAGTLALQGNWARTGTGTDLIVTVPGNELIYSNYNSGGGNYVSTATASNIANQYNKLFTTGTLLGTKTFYYSYLLNVTSAPATGGYFFSIKDGAAGSNYIGRTWIKSSGIGYTLGVSTQATAVYGSSVLNFGTTYLIVVSYESVSGAANDLAKIWINPSLSTNLIGNVTPEATQTSTTDPTNATYSSFSQRNQTSNNAAYSFDGLKVAYGTNSSIAWSNLDAAIPTNNWTGASSTSWNNTGNWSLGTVPLSTDNITISSGSPILDVDYTLASGRTLTISVTGTLTINPTRTLTIAGTADFGGKAVTLKSDATGTAAIGQITGTLSNASNVTVERYIPDTRRAYRFLAAPVTTTGGVYASWQESGTNAAGLGIQVSGIAGAAPGGIDNDSGLDKTLTGNSSMFSYNGSGWAAVTNTKTTQLTPGAGFRVLVRGDRLTDLYASSTPNPTATTIKATGTVGQGTITLNGLLDGFNLIGNPYPSSIDWNATGWQTARTATNLNDAIYIYDPANAASTNMSYPAYVSGAGTLNCTNIIRSGQAFFVHAAAAGASISFSEAYKSTTVTGGFFRSATPEMMRVTYMQNNEHLDDIVIRYNDDVQADFDPRFDAISMGGDANGLASFKNADRLAIHTRPTAVGEDSVALSVRNTTTGNYQLKFSEMEGFAASTDITLLDKFLNVQYDVKQDSIVNFEITTDVNSKGDDRFWLFYNHKSTGINQQALAKNKINVYPNPASSVINMSLKLTVNQKSTYTYNIYNQLGAMVQAGEVDFADGKQAQVNIDAFSPGVYFITASNGKDLQTIKFVK